MRSRLSAALLSCTALLACAAPAGAVIGGEQVAPEAVPWFASGSCGGTLVAPDRLLTAGHCVRGNTLADLGGWTVGGVTRNAVQFALHPNWRERNGDNILDDVGLIQLDQPVTTVAPATLGSSVPTQGTILGRGRSTAPESGRQEPFDGKLRQATLRTMSDSRCAKALRHDNGNGGERFDAKRMLCAIDTDGQAPLSSGCNGDSGGPLYAGTPAAPVLLGVVSYGGERCGADHLPSVFAEVSHYRSFITDPIRCGRRRRCRPPPSRARRRWGRS
jgi:secreted trypsin-like serine protease